MSYIGKRCEDCGLLVDQVFTDIRYAQPTSLEKLDKDLAAISMNKAGCEEFYADFEDDAETLAFWEELNKEDPNG